VRRQLTRHDLQLRWAMAPLELTTVALTTSVYAFVALRDVAGRTTLSEGTLVVFAGTLAAFLFLMGATVEQQLQLSGLLGRFARIFALLDRELVPETGTQELEHGAAHELFSNGVSYRSGPGEPLILRDVTFGVPRGARVALVGPSGA